MSSAPLTSTSREGGSHVPESRTFHHRAEPHHDMSRHRTLSSSHHESNADLLASNAKRTKVACDTCRRKKIKCSGESPCANCVQLKEPRCVYKDRQIQRAKVHKNGKRVSGVKAIQSMETRLLFLENTLMKISDKLDLMAPDQAQASHGNESETTIRNETATTTDEEPALDYSSSGDEAVSDDDDNDRTDDSENEPTHATPTSHSSAPHRSLSSKEKKLLDTLLGRELINFGGGEKFFGSHSVLSVCSDKSMEWIGKLLPPDRRQALEAFLKVPHYFFQRSKDFFRKWVDPILLTAENRVKILERPLPEDKEFAFDLVDNYYPETYTTATICEQSAIRNLFEIYYGLKKNSRRLTSSQLLMLCMATSSSIMVKVDRMSIGILDENQPEQKFHNHTSEQLITIQHDLMTSAIFLYHKISVFGHGIETIQGILMLLDAIECSHMTLNVDFMLLSVAIRFAEDMGLHRPELYSALPPEQVRLRNRIWCICYQYDVEYCYRTGKPPVINLTDVCDFTISFPMLLSEPEFANAPNYSHQFYASNDEIVFFDEARLRKLKELGGFKALHFYYVLLLAKIRFKAYSKLFSASANLRTYESVQEVLEDLNNDIWKLSNAMIDEFHPYFYDEPEFYQAMDQLDPSTKVMLVSLHLKFFFQLMVTNRVPFVVSTSHNNDKVARFRKIYLRSARAILHICNQLDYNNFHIRNLNWVSFFPFAAYLVLMSNCINNSFHPDCGSDLDLLVTMSNHKFGLRSLEEKKPLSLHISKITITLGLLELFLIVTFDVVSYKTNNDNYRAIAQQRFASLKKVAPELFKIKKSLIPLFNANVFQIRTPYDSMNGHDSNSLDQRDYTGGTLPRDQVINQSFGSPQLNGYDDIYNQSHSPSFNPALANIMDPVKVDASKESSMSETQSTPDLLNGSFSDVCGDEALASLVNSQMVALPNFFFDNNLGFQ